MPELIGQHEDILMDLELLKRYSQEKETLSDAQNDRLKRLPKAKREARKEEILKKQERERKERLRIRTLELEDKVRQSDLPPDITNEILDMLSYAKERNMTFIYSVEKKIEALEVKIKEAEIQKAQEEEKQMKAIQHATMVGAAVAVGVALAPYVQVRFDKEEFEKKSEDFYESKILPELLAATVMPMSAERTYPQKRGSVYSKAHYELAEKHKNELMDILVRDVQKSGTAHKTPEEIIKAFEKMPAVKQRSAIRTIRKQNPVLAARQDAEKKMEEKMTIDRGIIRLRRKHELRKIKLEKFRERQMQKLAQNLGKDRVQTKGPRIAERATNEKPALVKEVSPAVKQAQMAPTAVKEEKKGISARLMKVEQLSDKKEGLKGISAALAAAEQNKVQEAAERVRAESQKIFNPDDRVIKPLTPEQNSRIQEIVKGQETARPDFWRKDEKANGAEALIRGKDTKSREYWQNFAKRRYEKAV